MLSESIPTGLHLVKEKRSAEDKMIGWHHWLNGHTFEQTLGDSGGEGSLACCSPWGHKELDMSWWLNNNGDQSEAKHLGEMRSQPLCCRVKDGWWMSHYIAQVPTWFWYWLMPLAKTPLWPFGTSGDQIIPKLTVLVVYFLRWWDSWESKKVKSSVVRTSSEAWIYPSLLWSYLSSLSLTVFIYEMVVTLLGSRIVRIKWNHIYKALEESLAHKRCALDAGVWSEQIFLKTLSRNKLPVLYKLSCHSAPCPDNG